MLRTPRPLALRVRDVARHVVAQTRFLGMVVREFWTTLAGFLILVIGGGWILSRFYVPTPPPGGQPAHLGLPEGIWCAVTLVFFQPTYPFPENGWLQLLFFLLPIIGVALLAEGLMRFLTMLLSREDRLEDWYMCIASTYSDHIVLCGLGRIGWRILEQLQRTHEEVVVIEKDPECRFVKDARSMGVPVVIADPTRDAVLESVGVAKARTIIISTDDDMANLEIALDARDRNPGIRVVLRMFNEQLMQKVKKAFNIHLAFSTSALAGPVFASASASRAVRQSFYVDDQLLEVAEYTVAPQSRLLGWSLDDLKAKHPMRVISHKRGEKSELFPTGAIKLQAGDVLTVLASLDTVKAIEIDNA